MDLQKLNEVLKDEPKFRTKQVYEAIFQHFYSSFDKALNLPQGLREKLNKQCSLNIEAQLIEDADPQVQKALLKLKDGLKTETVLMRYEKRATVCVSSQVGCPLKCAFCATGAMGFQRNLSTEEILDQIIFWARLLKKENLKVTNVVFMGMGEPFLNYVAVMAAVKILNEHMGLGARRISISTAGVIEGIEKLAQEPFAVNLAFSLHAPDDELRSKLMPVNLKYPLHEVLVALKKYFAATHRRIMIEYVLIKGVNDSVPQARALVKLLRRELCGGYFVNLIVFNPTGKFEKPEREVIERFKRILEQGGLEVSERYRLGRNIKGACGQLYYEEGENLDKKN